MSNPNQKGEGRTNNQVHFDHTMTREEYYRFTHRQEIKPNRRLQRANAASSRAWKY